jgi:hypothetical protein
MISLPSILQLVEAECVTGRLVVEGGGQVGFFAGRPVEAQWGEVSGVAALLDVFVREAPSFALESTAVPNSAPLGAVLGLIMEGCRLADEWKRLAFQTFTVGRRDRAMELGGVSAKLAQSLDGSRVFELAVDKAGLARSAAIDPMLALIEEGVVHEVTSPPPPVREHGPLAVAGFGEAMDRGRDALRAGAYAEAAALFEAALALRPEDRVAAQNLRRVRELQGAGGNPFAQWTRRA